MKSSILLIFLLLTTVCNKNIQPDTNEYIEFQDIEPIDVKYIAPLIISKQKLNIKLDDEDLNEFGALQKLYPKADKQKFINSRYHLLITNENTYELLLSFIVTHPEFLSNNTDKINHYGFWEITANGKKYRLFYKTHSEFLKKLIATLEFNNCDKKVIAELGNIY